MVRVVLLVWGPDLSTRRGQRSDAYVRMLVPVLQ